MKPNGLDKHDHDVFWLDEHMPLGLERQHEAQWA